MIFDTTILIIGCLIIGFWLSYDPTSIEYDYHQGDVVCINRDSFTVENNTEKRRTNISLINGYGQVRVSKKLIKECG